MIAIPGYRIFDCIYSNDRTVVYRGERESDRVKVILKGLNRDYPTPVEINSYEKEYNLLSSLHQTGIIEAYDLHFYQNTVVLVLEDIGGKSLEQWLQEREFSLLEKVAIAMGIAQSLAQVHKVGLIHQNVSPKNIIYAPETQQLKIIDFEIARWQKGINKQPRLTSPPYLEGNLAYISPEQTQRINREIDDRTDFYALGVTLYQLFTNRLPFTAKDAMEWVHCHLAKQPVSLQAIDPSIPWVLSKIVLKLMAKNPEDRYQKAVSLQTDLERCYQQLQTQGKISDFSLEQEIRRDRVEFSQQLYEREKELETLQTAFTKVTSGSCQLILISGYSGVGKTQLVNSFLSSITNSKIYRATGKFEQYKQKIPYSALRQALNHLVDKLLAESETNLQQWRQKLLDVLKPNTAVLIELVPKLELILGTQPAAIDLPPAEAQNRLVWVFQNFIEVFAQPEHPLIFFLDDLQWADVPTLQLIATLTHQNQNTSLLIIGAYRDNEMNEDCSEYQVLKALNQNAATTHISLKTLNRVTLCQLIQDTLDCATGAAAELAAAVYHKTQGNPFFVKEFLRSLYDRGDLVFETRQSGQNQWQWDLEAIKTSQIAHNVLQLTLSNLENLSSQAQTILKIAASLGTTFSLDLVALAMNQPPQTLEADFADLGRAHLIIPRLESQTASDYQFSHDRIQQAAYCLMTDAEKPRLHRQLGRILQQHYPNRLFEIVYHLNCSLAGNASEAERLVILQCNYQAGQQAQAQAAYESALIYYRQACNLLTPADWPDRYPLALNSHLAVSEAATLSGHFEEVTKGLQPIFQYAETELDRLAAVQIQIRAAIAQSHLQDAIAIALAALENLGVTFPHPITPEALETALAQTARHIQAQSYRELLERPRQPDTQHLVILELLANICAAAYLAQPELFPFTVLKMVNLSIAYGNAPLSPFAYAAYGLILCGVTGEIDRGYEIGQFALELAQKLNAQAILARTLFAIKNQIDVWKVHLRQSLPALKDCYHIGVENGDFEFAGYAAMYHCAYLLCVGEPLDRVREKIDYFKEELCKINQTFAQNWLDLCAQVVLNLTSEDIADPTDLIHGEIYTPSHLAALEAANVQTGLFFFHLNQLIYNYWFDRTEAALESSEIAATYLEAMTGSALVAVYYWYDALVRLRKYPQASPPEQANLMARIAQSRQKLQHWATHAPMNYQHKLDLIVAESHRVLGEPHEAAEAYDRALTESKNNQYLHESALICELTARFYREIGKMIIAKAYFQESQYYYQRWGAVNKVRDLEQQFNRFFIQDLEKTTPKPQKQQNQQNLDLNTVLKASQALSSEIVLDKLLVKLLEIAVENAGAQIGYLIICQDDDLIAAARSRSDRENSVPCWLSLATLSNLELPKTIIHYVARCQETLVLQDGEIADNFAQDVYWQTFQPPSIFCTPIIDRGRLVGILYLENRLMAGAFSRDRLEVLQLLMSQAAISLENAQLYRNLEQAKQQLEAQVIDRTEQLQTSESRYRAIVEDQTELICRFRADGTLTFVNAIYCRSLQQSPENLLGRSFFPFLSGRDRQILIENLRQLTPENPLCSNEQAITINNRPRWYQWINRAIFDAAGNPIEYQAVGRDITERKRIEQELQKSQKRYELATQAAKSGVWEWKLEGDEFYIDPNIKAILGYSDAEIPNDLEVWSQYIHPEDRQNVFDLAIAHVEGKIPALICEHRMFHKDGSIRWILARGQAFRAENQQVVRLIGTDLDITAQKQVEQELQKAKEAADAANQAKSQFLNRMSHELRTPLNAILGFSQLLQNEISPQQNLVHAEYLGIINRSGEHLLSLIDDVLDMAKIETGKMTVNPTPVDLHHLLDAVVDLFQLKAAAKQLTLKATRSPQLPRYVLVDAQKLRQILINLLGNAIKFTEVGSVELIAGVQAQDNNPTVLDFRVTDTGPGINAADLAILFSPFEQTELGRQKQSGTGLGLSLSRQFARLMGGGLQATSVVNRGTTFYCFLPVVPTQESAIARRGDRGKIISIAAPRTPYRILVADDSASNRQFLLRCLQQVGFVVREARNGFEALEVWQTWHPHLICMDLQMNELDGYQATQSIRNQEQNTSKHRPPTQIIAISASLQEQEHQKLLAYGFDDFLSKPFRLEVIFEQLAQHLGISYIYESSSKSATASSVPVSGLTPEALTVMPPAWIERLNQAARRLDDEQCQALFTEIPTQHQNLKQTLEGLLAQFRFDVIMRLTAPDSPE